jgi:tight adherence protein C
MADMLYAHVLGGKNLDQAFRGAAVLAREPLGSFTMAAVREMELGATREEAFSRLLSSCPVRELSSLLRSVLEAEKRGHSLSTSLAVFSREIRLRRRDQVREAGARAPLKMLVPLIFLILPASVLLTVGPTLLATLQRVF